MTLQDQARRRLDELQANPYPGRGIVLGQSPDGRQLVQVYWIMGRSENSRNRIFVRDGDTVRTAPFDASKVKDPSLIIYRCACAVKRAHIVTNGDQTDTIAEALVAGRTFEQALCTRTFEPDAPNYTPRISGIMALDDRVHAYQLAILKAEAGNPEHARRQFFNYVQPIPGIGHCLTTYRGDGDPLPSFEGEPQPLPLGHDIDLTLDLFWEALNRDNRVALMVKTIDIETRQTDLRIVNRHG